MQVEQLYIKLNPIRIFEQIIENSNHRLFLVHNSVCRVRLTVATLSRCRLTYVTSSHLSEGLNIFDLFWFKFIDWWPYWWRYWCAARYLQDLMAEELRPHCDWKFIAANVSKQSEARDIRDRYNGHIEGHIEGQGHIGTLRTNFDGSPRGAEWRFPNFRIVLPTCAVCRRVQFDSIMQPTLNSLDTAISCACGVFWDKFRTQWQDITMYYNPS